ncbi:MAG: 30S ribosomal protein S12 methylthiotransferase RimO [Clostridia bacterium]
MTKEELKQKTISAISLGCDKNHVDLEHMLASLNEYGFKIVSNIESSNIIIVNTCAFILPAREEAIANILLALNQKKIGMCEKVIVCGCLPVRNLEELQKSLPEVDAFVNFKNNCYITQIIEELYKISPSKFAVESYKRFLTNQKHFAFLKISEGCDNGCAYCTIPRIRGRFRSIPMQEIITEATELVKGGVKELIIVAQDVTSYGIDLYGKYSLCNLILQLTKIKGVQWIRLHYCYPELVSDELLKLISTNSKVCKYIDIPLQHIDNKILKSMNRHIDEEQTRNLIKKIREIDSEIAIRSTFIIGLPGETHKQFVKLCKFLEENKLENVGFFSYSKEDFTKAKYMKHQIPNFIKQLRLKKIQKIQEKIAYKLNKEKVGQVCRMIIDKKADKNNFYARGQNNSPNVDFNAIISGEGLAIGEFVNVLITDFSNNIFKGVKQ